MLLAIDIGNTNLVIGCIHDDKILFKQILADCLCPVVGIDVTDKTDILSEQFSIGSIKEFQNPFFSPLSNQTLEEDPIIMG